MTLDPNSELLLEIFEAVLQLTSYFRLFIKFNSPKICPGIKLPNGYGGIKENTF